ncbi:MAG: RIO1 family regulatory kinase/ATPase [Candidatus Diapherotrites archaeon]
MPEDYLKEKGLHLIKKISKGHSSEVFLVEDSKKKKFALKIEKKTSTRYRMAEREAENLKLANSFSIGPKLIDFDLSKRIILMEFIEGKTFSEWLFKENPSRKTLKKFIGKLLLQARKLDGLGLDHGQLAGKGKNILVRKNLPVIIDFEKASRDRKCHNFNQLHSFLFRNPNSAITKKVKKISGNSIN